MIYSLLRSSFIAALAIVLPAVGMYFPAFASAAEIRIGYVNLAKVLEEAPQGVAARKKLESEFRPRDKELVTLQERVKQVEDEIRSNQQGLREAELRKRERELLSLKRELKRLTQEFREDYNQRWNEELSSLQQTVQRAVSELARQEKYDLLVNEGALFASDAIDITDKVLRRLGKQ